MTKKQINKLVTEGDFLGSPDQRELIETHISWVILCTRFVYKIKKPIQYSFLNFSSLDLRKHFCEREIELNKRFSENIYIDVQPVYELPGRLVIGGNEGTILDYAVRMNRMDSCKQMNNLLLENKVTESDIKNLAEKIAFFHKNTEVIYKKDYLDIKEKFDDLGAEIVFLSGEAGKEYGRIISFAMETSAKFIQDNKKLLADRLNAGFFRDCHGDLHSRNIFLLPSPQPFDCLEFNDDFRQIDVLNEVAFLCMDLDAFGRRDLSELFIEHYHLSFPSMKSEQVHKLFIYYKSYRANIRAKVNSLRSKSTDDVEVKASTLTAACNYLQLMNEYMKSLYSSGKEIMH